jgi:bifunctional DNA-binding transcriptional regulator/antitoxin component of YhaV-PrlF toxin-antitoxin module
MYSRKVIKNRDSYYINIPRKIFESMELKQGQALNIDHTPGFGIIIAREQDTHIPSANPESIKRLQQTSAEILYKQERRLKDLGDDFITKVMGQVVPVMVRSGVFDVKPRLSKIEKQLERMNRGRGKLIPIQQRKRNTQ